MTEQDGDRERTVDETPAAPPPDDIAPGDAVTRFHVGDARQLVVEGAPAPEPHGAPTARDARLKVPTSRPPFGTDDDGTPRPDPRLEAADAADDEEPAPTGEPAQAPAPPPPASPTPSPQQRPRPPGTPPPAG